MKAQWLTGLAAAVLVAGAQVAHATPVTFSGGAGSLAASVTFSQVAPNLLQVLLVNTSGADVMTPPDVLTGVYFDIVGNPTLGAVSAVLGGGATISDGSATITPPLGDVGGEFAYKYTGSGLGQGVTQRYGVSAAGMGGAFGASDLFPGPDLNSHQGPNGLDFGIVGTGDDRQTGNGGVIGVPLIQNSVLFTLSGFTGDLSQIGNVRFQYGTAMDEPSFPGCSGSRGCNVTVPEPTTFLLLAAGLASAVRRMRRA